MVVENEALLHFERPLGKFERPFRTLETPYKTLTVGTLQR